MSVRRVTPTRQPIKTKGRGALSNREGRFARHTTELDAETACTDALDGEAPAAPRTELHVDNARTIIARNASPDLPFSQSINPYRGCEHGCVYCYARTTHAYLDLSPGRDFETQIYYKPNAVELLAAELARPDYLVSPIALGTNTDPYQPVERRLGLTRGILELLLELRHPLPIVTKSGAVLRDLDLLEKLAAHGLAAVYVSVTTLDDELKRRLEPRTAGPKERLHVLRELRAPPAAARGQGVVRGVAPRALSGPRGARLEPDPADARRRALRLDLSQPPAGRGTIRAAAAGALRAGAAHARSRPGDELEHEPVSKAGGAGRPARSVVIAAAGLCGYSRPADLGG